MRAARRRRPSTYLIILALIILGLGLIMAYYVNSTFENLRYDARIINETGIIRGAIQRVSKLALSDSTCMYRHVIVEINELIEQFVSREVGYRHDGSEEALVNGLLNLRSEWHVLEHDLVEYQDAPTEVVRLAIVEKSESCWEAANQVVLTAQLATEEKVGGIRLFYNILLLNALTAVLVIVYVLLYVRRRLEFESSHDPLTGLFNRRTYESTMESELARSVRYGSPLSLIILDIDHFKKINDRFGHRTGDRVLVNLAGEVLGSIRETDSVFRIGGEEFAIICPESSGEGAYRLAEKVRMRVEQTSFDTQETETISLGVAEYSRGMTKEDLYHDADRAMYRAKENGRNRTEVYSGRDQ